MEQIAKAAEEQQKRELAAQRKAKYDETIKNADLEFNQERWEAARSLYSEASTLFPAEKYPQDQLVLVNTKLDEIAALEARRAAGIVESISLPTNRFYIIVSSSVDGDLAMDYASKLAKEGKNVKIIEPYAGNQLFHRVSVDDYGTWEEALTISKSLNGYESGAWILKH